MFKARPVPASSGQAPVPPRAARSRRHTTSFQPFHLNTEVRNVPANAWINPQALPRPTGCTSREVLRGLEIGTM